MKLFSTDFPRLFVSNYRSPAVRRLMRGLPHGIVLADASGDATIMLPSCDVRRPKVISNPFSTEVVTDRESKEWLEKVRSRFFMYPVHPGSEAYVTCPTLSSSLYITLCWLMAREYDLCAQSTPACQSDVPFTEEEAHIYHQLGMGTTGCLLEEEPNPDAHPDASGCRLKIALAGMYSHNVVPFSVPEQWARYLGSEAHVSMLCRLTADEKRRLVEPYFSLKCCGGPQEELPSRPAIEEEAMAAARSADAHGSTSSATDNLVARDAGSSATEKWIGCLERSEQAGWRAPQPKCLAISAVATDIGCDGGETMRLFRKNRGAKLTEFETKYKDAESQKHMHAWCVNRLTYHRPTKIDVKRDAVSIHSGPTHHESVKDLFDGQKGSKHCNPGAGWSSPGQNFKGEAFVTVELREARHVSSYVIRSGDDCPQRDPKDWSFEGSIDGTSWSPLDTVQGHQWPERNPGEGAWRHLPLEFTVSKPGSYRFYRLHVTQTRDSPADAFQATEIILFSGDQLSEAECQQCLKSIGKDVWDGNNGASKQLGFGFLYDLATDAINFDAIARGKGTGCARLLAKIWCETLMFKASRNPGSDGRVLLQILSVVIDHPREAWPRLDSFVDAHPRDASVKPFFTKLITLAARHGRDTPEPYFSDFPAGSLQPSKAFALPSRPRHVQVDLGESARYLAMRVTPAFDSSVGTDCKARAVYPVSHGAGRAVGAEALAAYTGRVLSSAGVSSWVRCRKGQSSTGVLPFSLDGNPGVTSEVAKKTIDRIKADYRRHQEIAAQEEVWDLPMLEPLQPGMTSSAATQHAESMNEQLMVMIWALQDAGTKHEAQAKACKEDIIRTLSGLEDSGEAFPDAFDAQIYDVLVCGKGRRPEMWLEHAISCVASSKGVAQIMALNRHITSKVARALLALVGELFMHDGVVRIARLCIGQAYGVINAVHSFCQNPSETSYISLSNNANSLAKQLVTTRECAAMRGGDACFEPRFAALEFDTGWVLRRRQVEMCQDIIGATNAGRSVVHQMIMGAGKTTIIAPLCCVILADGTRLVMMVSPAPLLPMCTGVMRNRLRHLLRKRVWTFEFGRSFSMKEGSLQGVLDEFQLATSTGDVVMTTPEAVKSLLLKYLETELMVFEGAQEMARPAFILAQVLGMWRGGTLIMDEVDLILHPLKSELNFPCGPKELLKPAPKRWELAQHILDGVFYATEGVLSDGEASREDIAVAKRLKGVILEGIKGKSLQRLPHLCC